MKKMNVNKQKELDYYNYEDIHNRFRNKIHFPTIQCIKLANILCQSNKMVDRYIRDYYNPEFEQWEIINSLQQFKRDLKAERMDINEFKEKIKNSIKTKNWQWLWVTLQDFFLEVLQKEQLNQIVELIHSGIDESDIVNWYKKDKKILAMTTFGVDYIKSVVNS
jgi:hypothetical protein